MNKKNKILAVIACVAVLVGIFCISSFAYSTGDIIPAGSIITFANTPVDHGGDNNRYSVNIHFTNNNTDYNMFQYNNTSVWFGNLTKNVYSSWEWANETYKVIEITTDYTIENNRTAQYFNTYLSVEEPPPPPPPPPLPGVVENVQETFSFTLTFGTLIISWLVANQIALAGLYLYILIALISVMKRFFVT